MTIQNPRDYEKQEVEAGNPRTDESQSFDSAKNTTTSNLPRIKVNMNDSSSYTDRAITKHVGNPSHSPEFDLEIPDLITLPDQKSFNNFDFYRKFRYHRLLYRDRAVNSYLGNTHVATLARSQLENCLIDVRKIESQFIQWSDKKPVSKCNGDKVYWGKHAGQKCVDISNHNHSKAATFDENTNCNLQNDIYIKYDERYYRYSNYQHVFHAAHIAPLWKLAEATKCHIFLVDLMFMPMQFDIAGLGANMETTFLKIHIK